MSTIFYHVLSNPRFRPALDPLTPLTRPRPGLARLDRENWKILIY